MGVTRITVPRFEFLHTIVDVGRHDTSLTEVFWSRSSSRKSLPPVVICKLNSEFLTYSKILLLPPFFLSGPSSFLSSSRLVRTSQHPLSHIGPLFRPHYHLHYPVYSDRSVTSVWHHLVWGNLNEFISRLHVLRSLLRVSLLHPIAITWRSTISHLSSIRVSERDHRVPKNGDEERRATQ